MRLVCMAREGRQVGTWPQLPGVPSPLARQLSHTVGVKVRTHRIHWDLSPDQHMAFRNFLLSGELRIFKKNASQALRDGLDSEDMKSLKD
jgi:hypothetical protein